MQTQSNVLPEGDFDLIYADPPWQYEKGSVSKSRRIENHYPTMPFEEIKELKIPAAKNSILYLWTTAPKLPEALEVMKAWGFTYRTCSIWDKIFLGMGYWFRIQHEILLVGIKGKFFAPEPKHRFRSVYHEKRGKHSKKPAYYYEIIEKMFPNASKIELFARNLRPGWSSWGNEI